MKSSSRDFWETFPLLTVKDGVIVSKRGDLTVGWKMTLPPAFSVSSESYTSMLQRMQGAIASLPPWMVVHRQDMFLKRKVKEEGGGGFLESRYSRHFNGREYLEHTQYIFLTLSSKASALRPAGNCGIYGLSVLVNEVLLKDASRLDRIATEFIHRLTDSGLMKAKALDDEELIQALESYISLGRMDVIPTDRHLLPDKVELDGMELWTYSLSESKNLQSAICPTSRADKMSSPLSPLLLSTGAMYGQMLDCEHIVNSFILTVPQNEIKNELESSRRNKVGMSKRSVENTANADEIDEFTKKAHNEQLTIVKAHNNIMVWCRPDEADETAALTSSALTSMGITCTRNTYDNAAVWYSSVPGGCCELGKQSFRTAELMSCLCLGINETSQADIPKGIIRLCDRTRHIPVRIDFQEAAENAGLVSNYNAFILGPSGSGKSFFTNHMVRSLYDNNQTVVIIDLGHSYQGLCNIIREESDGKDGHYMTWNPEDPICFDAFTDFDQWLTKSGMIRRDLEGVAHLEAILKSIWEPRGGWVSEKDSILFTILSMFVESRQGIKPIFHDLYLYIDGPIKKMQMNSTLEVSKTVITADRFDVASLALAMMPYSKKGQFATLYNNPNPKNLFNSRFTVFEVGALKELGEKTIYPHCILGIMLSFSRMMRQGKERKTLVIEEAWQAIANNQMSGFLKELWKTSRKHNTSAVMVTQELTDIMSSEVIKDTILQNSATKILLSQESNITAISQVEQLFGLTKHQKAMVMSVGLGMDRKYRYREVFISIGSKHCGVYGTELSRQEGYAYQSNLSKKSRYIEEATKIGFRKAADLLTEINYNDDEAEKEDEKDKK